MHRNRRQRVVTLPTGERVRLTVEGTQEDGFVQHIEHKDDRVDAIAVPRTVRYRFEKV
jgi:hypothetical protein